MLTTDHVTALLEQIKSGIENIQTKQNEIDSRVRVLERKNQALNVVTSALTSISVAIVWALS